jgi:hypothetical protein
MVLFVGWKSSPHRGWCNAKAHAPEGVGGMALALRRMDDIRN